MAFANRSVSLEYVLPFFFPYSICVLSKFCPSFSNVSYLINIGCTFIKNVPCQESTTETGIGNFSCISQHFSCVSSSNTLMIVFSTTSCISSSTFIQNKLVILWFIKFSLWGCCEHWLFHCHFTF